jgi:adenylate cyclase
VRIVDAGAFTGRPDMNGRPPLGDSAATQAQRVLHFEGFTLDPSRACLSRDGVEVRLRPKAFDLLRFLAERPGRLVTKDEIGAAVWPNVVVTDDSLVQCVRDVRGALGDDRQRIVRTVLRRGYLFAAEVKASVPQQRAAQHEPAAAAATDRIRAAPVAADPAPGTATVDRPGPEAGPRSPRTWSRTALGAAALVLVAAITVASLVERDGVDPDAGRGLTIAVLPFASLGAPDDRHFSDGLAEDLITAISRFRDVTVIARNSSFRYRADVDVGQAGRELGAAFVVLGSVGRDADRVRINVQLVDARSRATRWAERYDRPLGSLFELQDDVADRVVSKLVGHARHIAAERIRTRPPQTLEAYELVLRARPGFNTYTRDGLLEARALLQQATGLDPGYAPAWDLLAGVLIRLYLLPSDERHFSPQVLELARESALKALSLDANLSSAHALLGYTQVLQHQYDSGLETLRHAIALNPSDAVALRSYADALSRIGGHRQSIDVLARSLRLDPFSPPVLLGLMARSHVMLGEYDRALALARDCRKQASHVCLMMQAIAAARLGRSDEAQAVLTRLLEAYPNTTVSRFRQRYRLEADETLWTEHLRAAGLPE